MSLNFLSTRFRCSWPWDILVMLCDGRLVCGCADPYGRRVLGDARTSSIHDVWTGATIETLRRDLNAGGSKFCGDCPLKLPLRKDEAPPVRPLDAGALPGRMFIECTAACNISCAEACCAPETGITRTRQAGMLDFDLFRRVIDEVGPTLGRVDFFNYGEAFLHKRAVEMCEYIKRTYPHIYLYTSTNGLALTEDQARRLVHSGIDEVTSSVDGASQESYEKYRQRGKLEVALRNLRAMQAGELVVVYHTGDERAAVGLARVARAAYPDPRAGAARLVVVDLEPVRRLPAPVPLAALKQSPLFADSPLVRQGRLSVVPLTEQQGQALLAGRAEP